jgi:hypothetical protein
MIRNVLRWMGCVQGILIASLSLHATPAEARQGFWDLRIGTEVRVYAPHAAVPNVAGVVVAPPDTVLLLANGPDTTAIPLATVLRLDVRARPRSVWRPAAIFGTAGLVGGAVMIPIVRGLLCNPFNPCGPLTTERALAVVGGMGLVMAGLGAVVGLAENEGRPWYPVDLPRELRRGTGRIQVGLRLTF